MKKVLIITYYWPPASGPGMQRVFKFAKYLPKFGWDPVILTVEKGNFPSYDHSFEKEISDNIRVYRTKIFEPFEIYNKLRGRGKKKSIPTFILSKSSNDSILDKAIKYVRGNFLIPDAKIGWQRYIVKSGLEIIKNEKIDLIFSSSPPHSLQLGARKLAKISKLKWVADFRDPWTDAFWQKDIARLKFAKNKDKKYETNVLLNADKIITVGANIAKEFENSTGKKIEIISNGYDKSDFEINKTKHSKFRIVYAGTLGESQKIDNFIEALINLKDEFKDRLEVSFYGTFHKSITDLITLNNAAEIITIHEPVDHNEITKKIVNAEVLLLVIPEALGNEGILTGKLFEYLATNNTILGIGPKNGDASNILMETGAGKMFDYDDDITSFLEDSLNNWILNKEESPTKTNIDKYSRERLTEELSKIFEECL